MTRVQIYGYEKVRSASVWIFSTSLFRDGNTTVERKRKRDSTTNTSTELCFVVDFAKLIDYRRIEPYFVGYDSYRGNETNSMQRFRENRFRSVFDSRAIEYDFCTLSPTANEITETESSSTIVAQNLLQSFPRSEQKLPSITFQISVSSYPPAQISISLRHPST